MTDPTTRARDRWSGCRVVVVGAGRSGVAAARLLAHLGASVTLTDQRVEAEIPRMEERLRPGDGPAPGELRLALGGHPESLWADAEAVIASPGIHPQAPPLAAARARGLAPIAEIELAAALGSGPYLGITGSNGKSTVTAMVGAILRQAGYATAVCGNIGRPLSEVVARQIAGERIDRFVLELSSFQTEQIVDFHPRWASLLNISADHLDRHGDLESYGRAKLRLVHNCTAEDWLVYGADDPWLVKHLPRGPKPVRFAASPPPPGEAGAWIDDSELRWRSPEGAVHSVMPAGDLRVVGRHNAINACAAIALGCLAGAGVGHAAAALRAFEGLEHRMEPCGTVEGVLCINDSKATNVGATAAALAGMDRPVWLILGGRDKDSEFEQLRPLLAGVRGVLLIGESSDRIEAALGDVVATHACSDLERAIDTALVAAAPGEALLLAPACTSFDQFDDFEHRGRCFKELIAARATRTQRSC